ncbi:MAG: hypothetical protein M3R13_05720 [Armatimonadota bacterium]|nr:hypothetical protein [Armatimonadota bacterium]
MAKSSKVPSGDMTRKPSAKVVIVAGLLAGSVSAVVGYAWMYVAAAFLGFDNSMLMLSEATPHEVAMSSAPIVGFWASVLGALLVFGRRRGGQVRLFLRATRR